jgi:DNA-binding response OmpR family regulator
VPGVGYRRPCSKEGTNEDQTDAGRKTKIVAGKPYSVLYVALSGEATLTKSGAAAALTPLEFKILEFLVRKRNEAVSRRVLLDAPWGDTVVSPRTIEPHIVYLRKKLENDPSRPVHILRVRGVGYKFKA